jgi:hypothetical protein
MFDYNLAFVFVMTLTTHMLVQTYPTMLNFLKLLFMCLLLFVYPWSGHHYLMIFIGICTVCLIMKLLLSWT